MKNREFDIIFTFYGNDEGTIYGLVYKNIDCFLPINEYIAGRLKIQSNLLRILC